MKQKTKKRKQALRNKPVIEVKGKLGKPQKGRKRKIKKTFASSVDFYEDPVEGRELTLRPDQPDWDAPPKSLEQEIPRGMREFMIAKERAKLPRRRQKAILEREQRKMKQDVEKWFTRPVVPTPVFKPKPGESDVKFMRRMNQETKEFVNIARFENENECKVVMSETGEVSIERKVTRKQIKNKERKEKLKKLKQKNSKQGVKDFTDLTDEVRFNERVDRPPETLAKPRKAPTNEGMKGRLSSLKFLTMMGDSKEHGVNDKKVATVKSLAAKERLEAERQRVINLYRSMKSKKLHS